MEQYGSNRGEKWHEKRPISRSAYRLTVSARRVRLRWVLVR
jgi:hypothetical protein